jgi:antitoxin PrlF
MKASKLTTKYQTTVPKEVRELLGLNAGDIVQWNIEDDKVVISKLQAFDLEWHKAIEASLMPEWSSKEDDKAYESI